MDPELNHEGFGSISIKKSVAKKFRKYSRSLGKSQSMTLLLMLEFFENHMLTPTESLGPNMKSLEKTITQRINSLIAIIRNIEQSHSIPTKAMLEAMFEEIPRHPAQNTAPNMQQAFDNLKSVQETPKPSSTSNSDKDIISLLRKVETVKPSFGKPYYKLQLHTQELEDLKAKYYVYHD